MDALLVIALFLVLVWALAFFGAPLMIWVLGGAILLAALHLLGLAGAPLTLMLALPLLGLLAMRIAPLRRLLLTRPVMERLAARLPTPQPQEQPPPEIGDLWWEAELLRGRPDWNWLLERPRMALSEAERAFLEGECEALCAAIDDWAIEFEQRRIPDALMRQLREQRFLSMVIATEFGGLGFSPFAISEIVTRLATRSTAVAFTVAVANALGPAMLLQRFGKPEQQKQWLPSLASGEDIACFALAGPEGSVASHLSPDVGTVAYADFKGRRTLGVRLSFEKRWITLAPIATVIGLAFRLRDPEGLLGDRSRIDYGVTCAMLPADHPGVETGRRHLPGAAFMNGPVIGREVFIPMDWIIGGGATAGQGWRMIQECLAAGRGVLLPAIACAAAQTAYLTTGAYDRLRRWRGEPRLGGVTEAAARIAGLTYLAEATRRLSAAAVAQCTPTVASAIAKYQLSEIMRQVVDDALDVQGGRGILLGPRNYLAGHYRAVPMAISIEGANILTRSFLIFGPGATRCHPQLPAELHALRQQHLLAFDESLCRHIAYSLNRVVRAFTLNLFGGRLARSPVKGPLAHYYRQLERVSATLAVIGDLEMTRGRGQLRDERSAARLGDVLSHLYLASAALKYHYDEGQPEEDLDHLRWALDHSLRQIGSALEAYFRKHPDRRQSHLLRWLAMPRKPQWAGPDDALDAAVADQMMQASEQRDRMTRMVYRGDSAQPVGRLERAFRLLDTTEASLHALLESAQNAEFSGTDCGSRLEHALAAEPLSDEQAAAISDLAASREDALRTDDFPQAYFRNDLVIRSDQADELFEIT